MLIAHVIGHTGCPKCTLLNRRLDAILQEEPYPRGMSHKEAALVFYCQAQCVNPNRIPALIISDDNGEFLNRSEKPTSSIQLYQFIGIQTDYNDGGGILPPETIKKTLDEAIAYMDKRNS